MVAACVKRCNPCSALLHARCVIHMPGWLPRAGLPRGCLQAKGHPLAASARCGSQALYFYVLKGVGSSSHNPFAHRQGPQVQVQSLVCSGHCVVNKGPVANNCQHHSKLCVVAHGNQ